MTMRLGKRNALTANENSSPQKVGEELLFVQVGVTAAADALSAALSSSPPRLAAAN